MTPANIVRRAVEVGLNVLAITDHNEAGPLQDAVRAGSNAGVLVLPGVELATSGGHVLALFAPAEHQKVSSLLLRLGIESQTAVTAESPAKVLEAIASAGGIGLMAHVDKAPSGFEMVQPGAGQAKRLVWQSPYISGFEIADIRNVAWYTPQDPLVDRGRAIRERRNMASTRRLPDIGRVRSSDAHAIARVGLAADGSPRVTRLKMDQPNFPAIRVAFGDPTARVKIEDELPDRYPRIVGLACEGGFVDGLRLRFSSNLTSLIGGRGTGKSTVLETIRWVLGRERPGFEDQEGRAPKRAVLYFDGGDGRIWRASRERRQPTRVIGPTGELGAPLEVEPYSQGEIAGVANTQAERAVELLTFLDQFIDEAAGVKKEIAATTTQLEISDRQLAQIEGKIVGYEAVKTQLADVETKLRTGRADLERVVALRQRLAAAKRTRETLQLAIEGAPSAVERSSAALSPRGTELPATVVAAVAQFNNAVNAAVGAAAAAVKAASKVLQTSLETWQRDDLVLQDEADRLELDLQAKGLPRVDLEQLRQLLDLQDRLRRWKAAIEAAQADLDLHRVERGQLLERVTSARLRISTLRDKYANTTSHAIGDALDGGRLTLGFERGHLTAAYVSLLSDVVHGTYRHEKTLRRVTLSVPPEKLCELAKSQDVASLAAVEVGAGQTIGEDLAGELIASCRASPAAMHALEHVGCDDLPVVVFVMPDGTKRGLHQLSQGQRQTVLLAVAFASLKECPLLIDQPEDELDNQFVFERVVAQLRQAKERRQVIVVSHNANVVVLGDAELIYVMRRTDKELAVVDERGSIDNGEIRTRALRLLEGGQEAFERRRLIYDIRSA